MVTLQNEFLQVTIDPHGAQITSLIKKSEQLEYLWQADPAVWGFSAPNLFPVVGNCWDNHIKVDGKLYPMKRHGFARDSEFTLVDLTDLHAKFSLDYSEKTLAVYPFKFTFQVLYDLFDSELRISYKVINQDDKTIHFSLGAHPAFKVPLFQGESYEDYYIQFDNENLLEQQLLGENGFFTGKSEFLSLEDSKLKLSRSLFDKGALVFKRLQSRELLLKNIKTPNFISISFPHFESLALWAPPGAPFVCIEPWIGYADHEGEHVEFRKKEGVKSLEHGHVFEVDLLIGVN